MPERTCPFLREPGRYSTMFRSFRSASLRQTAMPTHFSATAVSTMSRSFRSASLANRNANPSCATAASIVDRSVINLTLVIGFLTLE